MSTFSWQCIFAPYQPHHLAALALLATTALSTPASAQFPAVIELSDLDGSDGFTMNGIDNGDFAGWSVASADVNGDGFDDIVIGARGADQTLKSYAGEVYVVFGRKTFPASLALSTLDGTNGFRLDGIDLGDQAGNAVANAGDVNGDGIDDIVIGAYAATPAGESYVVFGSKKPFPAAISLSALTGANGFRIDGAASGDLSGAAVAGAGDVNGDDFDDILIGAPQADPGGKAGAGESYVVFGKAKFPASIAVASLNGSNGFRLQGVDPGDYSGSAVAGAGDVDGDGFDDMLIGAPFADNPPAAPRAAGDDSGEAYLVQGGSGQRPSTFDLDKIGVTVGVRYRGSFEFDLAGDALYGSGDVNGDGFKEVGIGAPNADYADFDNGKAHVVYGQANITPGVVSLDNLGTSGFALKGVGGNDRNGYAIAGGDINGDGYDDLVTGTKIGIPGVAGKTHALFGKNSGLAGVIQASALNGTNGFTLNGASAGDNAGTAVATGDVNGDGLDDIIVGARGSVFGSTPGTVYVIYGRAPDKAVMRYGSAAGQYITGGSRRDSLYGRNGDDYLEGRGGGDMLDGGSGDCDIAVYLHAPAGVTANLSKPALNTGDAEGDSYFNIEGLKGSRFADTLTGNDSPNHIIGDKGDDRMRGNGGNDLLLGGPGQDIHTGGSGLDTIKYVSLADSPTNLGKRDIITDFNVDDDTIDVSVIDAKEGPGNQSFTFIGTAEFTAPGQIRVVASGLGLEVQLNVNDDLAPDGAIYLDRLTNPDVITAINFVR